jgi:hypothetical protein
MPGADTLRAALARPDLSPTARAFLDKVQRRADRRPPTPRELAAVERIASGAGRLDFGAINRAAIARLSEVLARLLPAGRAVGAEWHAGSLHGEAGDSLRVRLRGERAGRWQDFATGEKGGDPVSLAAAVAALPQAEAARRLAGMLGMEGGQ